MALDGGVGRVWPIRVVSCEVSVRRQIPARSNCAVRAHTAREAIKACPVYF